MESGLLPCADPQRSRLYCDEDRIDCDRHLSLFVASASEPTNMPAMIFVTARPGYAFFIVDTKPPQGARFRFNLETIMGIDVPRHTAIDLTPSAATNNFPGYTTTYLEEGQLTRLKHVLGAFGLEGKVITYTAGAGSSRFLMRTYEGRLTLSGDEMGDFTRSVFDEVFGLQMPYRVTVETLPGPGERGHISTYRRVRARAIGVSTSDK
jgi:hypothetical protein